ncbi:phenylalanine--tRNA ligase subunit beta [Psychroflexus planctonicus]|uniref:Phenylalanine--tRNA ligase beta subunit n=1 Tax=Psychroflexus planctonicus TaxID=1526575 RepID=A0ABQ1SEC4_9FLAO|nr:phenylalanine--tRNA ligase subunit beta [Psychroflexus planctonicus]GGE33485.1 phenylalanine--tRNA ligase beta subunit [Psychroflexus planctonicus]
MKISYNWLKQFINTKLSAEKVGELLTDLGLEVEGITDFESVKGGLKGIVVGEVVTCKQHPNADRLKLTEVNVGEDKNLQIVCGAPNVAAGQKVPVAVIGTTLYDEKGEAWKIKKGKIRGEASHGMICAEDEIGLGKSHDGIMVLDESLKPGTPLNQIFEIETDKVFEIGLTPNRADAMSHWGVARDLRAALIQIEKNAPINTAPVSSFHVEDRSKRINIKVENSKLAPRYCGLTISDIQVKESPLWLQNRLKAIGVKPINNVVDVTNFVLHDLGQPLHAFDADKIKGNKIIVKTLPKGTKFTTLDEVERELHEEDLMICDEKKPLCIAGVFGGLESGVTESTSSIFLESAYFDPVSVRKTAKRHALNTDASFRFERGIDPNITEYALQRAAILIEELTGGKISSDIDDFYPKKIEDFQVFLTFDKINQLIGEEIDSGIIKTILSSLEIKVNNVSESGMGLTIPAYRVDVRREVDVIEEILRVYGYNNIKLNDKFNVSVAISDKFEDHKIQQITAQLLVAKGFYETMANSLTTPKYIEFTKDLTASENVEILNPLSRDLSVMRQSMLFSGLESLAYNLNRQNSDLKFFEFGKTYHQKEKREEYKHLSLLVTGSTHSESWTLKQAHADFFYFKGIIESILQRLGITDYQFTKSDASIFAEGLVFQIKDNNLVTFGRVNQSILKEFDIDQNVLYADFNWNYILKLAKKSTFQFQDIPKFPSVRRDFALLVDDAISFDAISQIAYKTEKKILKSVNLFDVYQGENLPKGKKSYAVSFTFQDAHKTLTDKQIDKTMDKFLKQFQQEIGASLR